jgi:hypothetical protein
MSEFAESRPGRIKRQMPHLPAATDHQCNVPASAGAALTSRRRAGGGITNLRTLTHYTERSLLLYRPGRGSREDLDHALRASASIERAHNVIEYGW